MIVEDEVRLAGLATEMHRNWVGSFYRGNKASASVLDPEAVHCFQYRPAARYSEPIDTSTSHVGFQCVVNTA